LYRCPEGDVERICWICENATEETRAKIGRVIIDIGVCNPKPFVRALKGISREMYDYFQEFLEAEFLKLKQVAIDKIFSAPTWKCEA
jgi:hypothetical protein